MSNKKPLIADLQDELEYITKLGNFDTEDRIKLLEPFNVVFKAIEKTKEINNSSKSTEEKQEELNKINTELSEAEIEYLIAKKEVMEKLEKKSGGRKK